MKKERISIGAYAGKRSLPILFLGVFLTLFLPVVAHAATCAGNATLISAPAAWNDVGGSSSNWLAVPFTPSTSCTVTDAKVQMFASSGAPSDLISVSIYSDASGVPGSSLASGSTLSGFSGYGGSVQDSTGWSITLSAGTQYWLVLTSNRSSNPYFNWVGVPPTDNGVVSTNNGSTWSTDTGSGSRVYEIDGTTGGGGGGGSGGGFGPGFSEIFGTPTTTPTTTTQYEIVDDPTQDFFDGFVVFYGSAVFIIWFFRRKN